MKLHRRIRATAVAIVLGGRPAAADAHEFWLRPTAFEAEAATPASPIGVTALVGTGFRGEPVPFAAPRTVRWIEVGAGGAARDLAPETMNGAIVYAALPSCGAGGAVLAYESSFRELEMDPVPFNRYLQDEGLDSILAARRRGGAMDRPGRERYRRCAKTWIHGSDATRVTREAGLAMEIVPLADPSSSADRPVTVLVLFAGRPAPGVLVRAWCRGDAGAQSDSLGAICAVRTKDDGTAQIAIDRNGTWLLSAVHMQRSTDPAKADWESTWASLTFRRGSRGGNLR